MDDRVYEILDRMETINGEVEKLGVTAMDLHREKRRAESAIMSNQITQGSLRSEYERLNIELLRLLPRKPDGG